LQVVEGVTDERRVFDAGDDLDRSAAVRTGVEVDVEHAL
jgi:hypothetical protein